MMPVSAGVRLPGRAHGHVSVLAELRRCEHPLNELQLALFNHFRDAGARPQSARPVPYLCRLAGKNHHRNLRVEHLELAQKSQPVAARPAVIGYDQIELLALGRPERLRVGRGFNHLRRRTKFEQHPDKRTQSWLVVDQQDGEALAARRGR